MKGKHDGQFAFSLICLPPRPGTDSIEMNGKTPIDVSGLGIRLLMSVLWGTEQKASFYCICLSNCGSGVKQHLSFLTEMQLHPQPANQPLLDTTPHISAPKSRIWPCLSARFLLWKTLSPALSVLRASLGMEGNFLYELLPHTLSPRPVLECCMWEAWRNREHMPGGLARISHCGEL